MAGFDLFRITELVKRTPAPSQEGGFLANGPWFLPDGSLVASLDLWAAAWIWAGYGFNIQAGLATTPITFAGAYDADAPDLFVHIPNGYAFIPLEIEVTFEAVGTESTMEIMALASPEGDSSATVTGGALATVANMRVGSSITSGVTASGGVDAAGITDPNVTGSFTFWRAQRPLTDTVATTENDRHDLNFRWNHRQNGAPPVILGSPAGTLGSAAAGGSLSVYAASQAGTGFIIVNAIILPPTLAQVMFGNAP
ncbi:MAG: hypothetical protein A3E01_15380 [Gammaproteobacteria bacterium RIFCSPHIGHO2_12_FULL_63_22]|nr:MAG: hypothetical protein A3E01_15380 [Gammaproteobacteria bacterium RIFCSPHIGHO2_12_FULL_63_22]